MPMFGFWLYPGNPLMTNVAANEEFKFRAEVITVRFPGFVIISN